MFVLMLLGLMTSACQNSAADTAAAKSANGAINEATFIATEYAYEGPESLPAGWTRLTLDNQGKLAHDLIAVKLAEGKSFDDFMIAMEAGGPPEWVQVYGNVTADPGQSQSYLVNLTPGNYVLISFGQAEDAPPDVAQGMKADLTVIEAQSEVAETDLPQANAKIELVDFQFVIDKELKAGQQTLQIGNTGMEMHELVIYRLKEGKTIGDFQAALEKEMQGEMVPEAEMPVEEEGVTFMSPGVSTYVVHNFEPGNYIFICHIPSPKNEMHAHYELGMIREVSIQ
jgi:uncharacterized cupredoxin-like copper-binding protein